MLEDTLLVFQTGKEKQIWLGNRHVLDQTVLRAVIQCVLADGDLTVYEMFSVGSKAVAGLPP